MKTFPWFIAVGLAVAGCSKSKPVDCDKYVAKYVQIQTAEVPPGNDAAANEAYAKKVHDIADDQCHSGKVTDKDVKCVETSRTSAELRDCVLH